ncbi:Sodium/potassium-transporting ATPase subunit alpha-1 [Bagarius yarrelli]|uniref:Sodium/potassium-transporting ATPase subunit alpha-1 n=1 Tax=Bagarius yarrelli TaxID=175774 RepID=A0A556TKC9_BAGYA|nr:Sodium/potassium-transporting ATPase subunit alpha-1 [Bagarius yarrelli]
MSISKTSMNIHSNKCKSLWREVNSQNNGTLEGREQYELAATSEQSGKKSKPKGKKDKDKDMDELKKEVDLGIDNFSKLEIL